MNEWTSPERDETEEKRRERAYFRLGSWEADSEMEISVKGVYEGVPLGSTPVEGRGREQEGAEVQRSTQAQGQSWLTPQGLWN